MALQKDFEFKGLTVQYWKISPMFLDWYLKEATVTLYGWTTQALRDAGKPHITQQIFRWAGTANQIDNFTSLTVYATDAATIRNDIYRLAQTLKTVVDAL